MCAFIFRRSTKSGSAILKKQFKTELCHRLSISTLFPEWGCMRLPSQVTIWVTEREGLQLSEPRIKPEVHQEKTQEIQGLSLLGNADFFRLFLICALCISWKHILLGFSPASKRTWRKAMCLKKEGETELFHVREGVSMLTSLQNLKSNIRKR